MTNLKCVFAVAFVLSAIGLNPVWAQEKKITIIEDAEGNEIYRHEAITGLGDDDVTVTVKTAPPEPKTEEIRIEAKPDPNAVWIPGYWRWKSDTSEYEWVSGVWRREIPDAVWHPGEWKKIGDSWEWQPGYWAPKESKTIIVKQNPPEPRKEDPGDPPGEGYIWVPGVWKFEEGKYVWISGSWERPATKDMTYIAGRWVKTSEGYRYIPGYWDYDRPQTRTYIVESRRR